MLVLLSDLHLCDGTSAHNVHPEAFAGLLLQEIRSSALSKKAVDLHIVLLGDIVDLVRTDYWVRQPKDDRPWNGSLDKNTAMNPSPAVQTGYETVLMHSLETETADALRTMIQGLTNLSVDNRPIPLTVTYVVGNHDRAFHNYPTLQQTFSTWLNMPVAFEHALHAPDYNLIARHGHVWDDSCHSYDLYTKVLKKKEPKPDRRDPMLDSIQNIGEVVTAELMSGLVCYIGQGVGANNSAGLVDLVKEGNNVRPEADALLWVEWMGRNVFNTQDKKLVMDSLKMALDGVLSSSLAKWWDKIKTDTWITGDLTDRLTLVKAALKGNFDDLKKIFPLLAGAYEFFTGDKDKYAEHALTEISETAGCQYAVYGHTHFAKTDYFSGEPDGRVKMYINTGTFLPLIQKASVGGYGTDYRMTLTFFYRGDEDTRDKRGNMVSLESWQGRKRKQYNTF
ncbi:hypothetical protein EHM69_11020 [candidate division KSB1 bacterium]|nr:MAG: hypothetical protein EHM69_11020 [candidate division KSB1 bacterium]